jgi:hypothetical protein
MSKRRRQQRKSLPIGAAFLRESARKHIAVLSAHPLRSLGFALLSLFLVWLVAAKSLPYALASRAPDSALALNSNNPEAIAAKAALARGRLQRFMGFPQTQTAQPVPGQRGTVSDTISALPEAGPGLDAESERDGLREEIRALALRTIANDPLNAQAFRLLGETTSDPAEARSLMQEAMRRSRRESAAIFWLLNDAYYRKDAGAALDYADILLRTRPELARPVFTYFAAIAKDREARSALARKLAANPPWRRSFLWDLPAFLTNGGPAAEITEDLRSLGSPAAAKDLWPLLVHLIERNRAGDAYNVWLATLSPKQLENLGLLTNPGFESDPSGSPFDWKIERGLNAGASLSPLGGPGGRRQLHVTFGGGRVRFPEVSQVLLLGPGRYRIEGALRGTIAAKRGLRWELRCAAGSRQVLGGTEMLVGQSQQWRQFSLSADVPSANCEGQVLRLYHDARSASEEFLAGEVWFSGLRLDRMQNTAQK